MSESNPPAPLQATALERVPFITLRNGRNWGSILSRGAIWCMGNNILDNKQISRGLST